MSRPYNPLNGGQNADNFAPGGYYNPTGAFGGMGGNQIGSSFGPSPAPPAGIGSSFGPSPAPPATIGSSFGPSPMPPSTIGSGFGPSPMPPSTIGSGFGPSPMPPGFDQPRGGPYIPRPPISMGPNFGGFAPGPGGVSPGFGGNRGMMGNRAFASPFTQWAQGLLRQLSQAPSQPAQNARAWKGYSNPTWE